MTGRTHRLVPGHPVAQDELAEIARGIRAARARYSYADQVRIHAKAAVDEALDAYVCGSGPARDAMKAWREHATAELAFGDAEHQMNSMEERLDQFAFYAHARNLRSLIQ